MQIRRSGSLLPASNGCRHLVFDLHGQRRTAGLTQQRTEELGRTPSALSVVGHQQGGEGHQTRPCLSRRHAAGQLRTGGFPARGTCQPMPLVLGLVSLDGMAYVVLETRLRVLINLQENGLRSVNHVDATC